MTTSYIAARDIGQTKYHLRRLNYLNNLIWDEDEEFLAVYVNGQEVQFDFWNDGSIIHLIDQPKIGDEVLLKVEPITFLE